MANTFETTSASAPPMGDPTRQPQSWYVTTEPTDYPVTLELAKEHLRITGSNSDSVINTLIAAATDYAEDRLAACLMPRTILATFYDGEPLYLPRGPLIEILSVVDGNETTLTGWELKHAGHRAQVILDTAASYPIGISYRAGYADADSIPAAIKLAILAHVGTLFEARESTSEKPRQAAPHSLDDFYRLKGRSVGVG